MSFETEIQAFNLDPEQRKALVKVYNDAVTAGAAAGAAASNDADEITYDNSGSGLVATDVQAAIDEIAIASDEADEIAYDNSGSGLVATDVQAAIDEVAGLTGQAPYSTGANDFVVVRRIIVNILGAAGSGAGTVAFHLADLITSFGSTVVSVQLSGFGNYAGSGVIAAADIDSTVISWATDASDAGSQTVDVNVVGGTYSYTVQGTVVVTDTLGVAAAP